MSQPFEVRRDAHERDGAGGDPPVVSLWRHLLRWLIVAAFVLRAAISLLDVQSVAEDSLRTVPLVSSVGFATASPAWPFLWGALSLIAAVGLAAKIRVGWLVSFAVATAYFVAGIADVTALTDTSSNLADSIRAIAVNLVVPIVILSGLLSIRVWYLPEAHSIRLAHAGVIAHAAATHGAGSRGTARGTPQGSPTSAGRNDPNLPDPSRRS